MNLRLQGATALCLLSLSLVGCFDSGAAKKSAPPAVDDGAASPQSPSAVRFSDVAAAAGVESVYRNGEEAEHYSILESLGGGVGLFDYDGDGQVDLFFPQGGGFEGQRIYGLASALYRNVGGLEYVEVSKAAAGGLQAAYYSHGAYCADYDNDGFSDVLVTGYGGLQLWRNQGDGTLTEVRTAAGLDDELWSSAAAWGDFNSDGALDLYVAHYVNWSFENHPFCRASDSNRRDVCPPREYDPLPDVIYLSDGAGGFRRAPAEAGLRPDGKGLGVIVCDLDNDGDADIYVANDTTDNFLYLNDGAGQFEELAMQRGVAVDNSGIPNGSMGLDVCDFNHDGKLDIFVANYEREDFAMYRNEGYGNFLHVSRRTGLTVLGGLYVGFGAACEDFDHDGDEDIVVLNGHVIRFPTASPLAQEPLLLENRQSRFHRVEFDGDGYFAEAHLGRGLAVGDLDRDGDLDLVTTHLNAPAAVLRNELDSPSQWLHVRLVGARSNRDAIGAALTLHTSVGDLTRHILGGGSYLSTNESCAFWGIPPAAKIEKLTVRWPGGAQSTVAPLTANQRLKLVEPQD